MTTTPNLPPLPDEDGYIPIIIAGRLVEVNAYRNSTMEAYATDAYQSGRLDAINENPMPIYDEGVSAGILASAELLECVAKETARLEKGPTADAVVAVLKIMAGKIRSLEPTAKE